MTIDNHTGGKLFKSTVNLWVYLIVTVTINIPYLFMFTSWDFFHIESDIWTRLILFYGRPAVTVIIKLWNMGALVASFSLILLGIRKLRDQHSKPLPITMVIIGICLCVSFFVAYFFVSAQTTMYSKIINQDIIPKIEEKLKDSKLTASQKAFAQRLLAKEIYTKEGRLITISDDVGNQIVFTPTKKDEAYKLAHDTLVKLLPESNKAAKRGMILWATILLLSIVIGCFSPIKNKSESNKSWT